jgi:apolipoprotein N-acyltransferase
MPRLLLPFASLACGAVAALGFAPLDLWPLSLLAVAGLLWLVAGARNGWTAAGHGWLFGTAMFAVSLNWIATAFTYQSKMDPALGWAAVLGLAAYLALFVAVPAGVAAALGRTPLARTLALAALWVPAEWLRGVALTGFAWNPMGAIWLPVPGMAQLAAVVGAIGLSFVTLLCAAALLWLLAGARFATGRGGRLAGAVVLAAAGIAGLAGNARIQPAEVASATLVVVQSGIGQDVRYDPDAADRHLATYLALTTEALSRAQTRGQLNLSDVRMVEVDPGEVAGIESPLGPLGGEVTGQLEIEMDRGLAAPEAPDYMPGSNAQDVPAAAKAPTRPPVLVLWSEGAIDGLPERDAALLARLAAPLGKADLLIAGGTGMGAGDTPYANSLFVIGKTAGGAGRIVGRYDKAHLVPGGEYLPWRSVLEPLGLGRLVPGDFDFAGGPGPRTLALPGFLPMSPMICYEIIFPGAVVDPRARPGWIANVSNDAWFGPWGPPQHLAQARLRAIEEGLPVARATPTGVSAVIDGHGQILDRIPPGNAGAMVTSLPPPLPVTPFARAGHLAVFLAALGALVLALGQGRRSKPGVPATAG